MVTNDTATRTLDLRADSHFQNASAGPEASDDAIFILSPLPRSGTNFLWDLLRLHDDVAAGRSPIWEDYLVKNSHHLLRFAAAARASWDPVWGSTADAGPELMKSLGDALIQFMTVDPQRRLVTKSPTLDNLEFFFDVFPDAHLLLLVRDGRDVVDSGITTFGWDLVQAARAWAAGVDRLVQFTNRSDIPREQCSLVRYEDLHQQRGAEMQRLLRALRLDQSRYNFDAMHDIPVRGSSTYRGADSGAVHWNPVAAGPAFNPIRRWESWDAHSHAVFRAAAGSQLAQLGYLA